MATGESLEQFLSRIRTFLGAAVPMQLAEGARAGSAPVAPARHRVDEVAEQLFDTPMIK